jgi:hypothetical protein
MLKEVTQERYMSMIRDFERNFDTQLDDFMKQLLRDSHVQYNSHLSNLCTRLDFNAFYTRGT